MSVSKITIIQTEKKWYGLGLNKIWQYRELLYFLVWRDIKIRYKQAFLGVIWAFMQPFTKMVVFSVIFGNLIKINSEGFPYPIFLYAGLLPWEFFSNAIMRSGDSILSNVNLITKVNFPRLILPIASIGTVFIDFTISFVLLVGMIFYFHIALTNCFIMIGPLILITILLSLGVGILFSALNTEYRDFRYILPFLVQIWMYLTPVIYPVTIIPKNWQWIVYLNPMAGIINGYRSAILGKSVDWFQLGISLSVATSLFIVGVVLFKRIEKYMADIV